MEHWLHTADPLEVHFTGPTEQVLAAAENVEVLSNFLRLLQRRKLAETQRVAAQLAGVDADLREAESRLSFVLKGGEPRHAGGHCLWKIEDQILHRDSEGGHVGGRNTASTLAGGRSGNRKRQRVEGASYDAIGTDEVIGTVSLHADSKHSTSIAAHSSLHSGAPPLSTAAERALRVLPFRNRAEAHVMAAFPVVDKVYSARRAVNRNLPSNTSDATESTGKHQWGPAPPALASPLVVGSPLKEVVEPVKLAAGEVAEGGEHRFAPGGVGDHLTLFGQDLAAFTRYSELKVLHCCVRPHVPFPPHLRPP